MNQLLPIFGIIFAILVFSAFFVAAEAALISLRDSQITRIVETKGRRGQRLG